MTSEELSFIFKKPRKDLMESYLARTPRSKALYERSDAVTPGGVGSGFRYFPPYPFYIDHARGSRFWDVDGNEYIDYLMGYGPLVGGHANPVIVEAIAAQLDDGTHYAIPHPKTAELLEELLRRYTMMGGFRLTNSGTESTMHAIRLARAYTEREKIVKMEGAYHGAHDSVLVSVSPMPDELGTGGPPPSIPQGDGIPGKVVEDTLIALFNDVETLEEVLRQNEGEVAALIIEPVMCNSVGVIPPKNGYLKDIRNLTEEHDILLILDEVKTGVRVAPGGAAELYGVDPDIVTLAKAMGGGVSIGAFGAKEDIMEELFPKGHTVHAGTYNANPLCVAAALATLKELLTDDAYKHIHELNGRLAKGATDLLEESRIEGVVSSVSPMGHVYFMEEAPTAYRSAMANDLQATWDFWYSMLNRGILIWAPVQLEQWNITTAHTKEDIDKTLEAMGSTLSEMEKSVQ